MAPRTARRTDNVTLASIAKVVGVSVSTVSNAYNHPDQLTAELRARILKTARGLGYSGPNPVARTLRRGQVGALGIIFDDPLSYAFTDPAAVLTLQGVAGACEHAGAGLVLIPRIPDDDGEMIRTALVDGFIAYTGVANDPRNDALEARGLPYVGVDGHAVDGVPWVGIDDCGAAEAAARHLVGLGHRGFGIISLPLRDDGYEGAVNPDRSGAVAYYVTERRLEGYRRALEATGVAWSDVAVEERQPHGFAAGERAAAALLDRAPRPTAILAMSDELALGALAAAAKRGIAVPDALSIVGFDDTPPRPRPTRRSPRCASPTPRRAPSRLGCSSTAGREPTACSSRPSSSSVPRAAPPHGPPNPPDPPARSRGKTHGPHPHRRRTDRHRHHEQPVRTGARPRRARLPPPQPAVARVAPGDGDDARALRPAARTQPRLTLLSSPRASSPKEI